jgi:hypothetical protein
VALAAEVKTLGVEVERLVGVRTTLADVVSRFWRM